MVVGSTLMASEGVCHLIMAMLEESGFGQEDVFAVSGGIIEVQPDIVTILADVAENVMEIDIARAEAAKERAEKYLAEEPPPDTDTYLMLDAALRRSKLRLDVVKRYRPGRRSPIAPILEDDTPG